MRITSYLALLVLGASYIRAEEPVLSEEKVEQPVLTPKSVFKPTSIKAPFLEQFTDDWSTRWFPSTAKKVIDGVEDDALLAYRGEWAVESDSDSVEGSLGLVLKTAAAHHAISAKFDSPIDPDGKTLVFQYEVKLKNGLDCGGAYAKLLTADPSFVADKFSDKTPYTIMFGPDKCGTTNKVHFIFRHQNPITKEFEEKHFNLPPSIKADKNTNLYTLIVNPDQTFEILINNESQKKGSLLEDFIPAVNPPKEIDDESDKKPEDWVDEAQIPDPDATKPDDWDESAPFEIEDEKAEKPEDWLDDEPLLVPDPEAVKPEDWDDEEDGDWVAPQVSNPKCEAASGCGEWKRPVIKNPNYKGIWKAPMIDNPAYKGEWKPRKIPNPNFFEDMNPAKFTPLGGIGFELWTMQDQITFDNIYVGHSVEDAKKLAEETWKVKFDAEELANKAEEKSDKQKEASGKQSFFEDIVIRVSDFIRNLQIDPVQAVKDDPITAGSLGAAVLLPILTLLLLSSGSSAPKEKPKKDAKPKESKKEDEKEEVIESSESKDSKGGAKKRKGKNTKE